MSELNETLGKEIAADVEGSILATLIAMAHMNAELISLLLERELITELDVMKMLEPLEKARNEKPTPFRAQRIAQIMKVGAALEIRDRIRWPED